MPVTRPGMRLVLMHLGDSPGGQALEVGVVDEGDTLVVIHAMALRRKFQTAYDDGRRRRR